MENDLHKWHLSVRFIYNDGSQYYYSETQYVTDRILRSDVPVLGGMQHPDTMMQRLDTATDQVLLRLHSIYGNVNMPTGCKPIQCIEL
jgi:hypothetical protein